MITLLPDDTGVLDHEHRCTRCPKVKSFPQEPVEDEMVQMLLGLVYRSNVPVSLDTEPPTYIH